MASLAAMQASGAGIRGQGGRGTCGRAIRIEPNPGYQRIAREEARTTKEVVEAQLRLAEGPWAQQQPDVASMTAGPFEHKKKLFQTNAERLFKPVA